VDENHVAPPCLTHFGQDRADEWRKANQQTTDSFSRRNL